MYGIPTHFFCEYNFVMLANHGEVGSVGRGTRRCDLPGIRGHSGDAGVPGVHPPALVRRLDLVSEPALPEAERKARHELIDGVLKGLDELEEDDQLSTPAIHVLRTRCQDRRRRLALRADGNSKIGAAELEQRARVARA